MFKMYFGVLITVLLAGTAAVNAACVNPPIPDNGYLSNTTNANFTLFEELSKITQACNVGYTPSGSSADLFCYNGTWIFGNGITCTIKDCGSPPSPANGVVSLSTGSSTFQSTSTQKCNCGYNAGNVTQKTITCQSTGKWETGINCAPKDCGPPPAPANGTVTLISVNTLIFSHATQNCNIGYKSFGSSADIFCLDYGWSTNITGIVCQIRDCGSPPSPANGNVSLSTGSSTFQSTATQKCNYGYNEGNVTQKTITCQSTGKWETGINCAPKDCGPPPAPANGTVTLISVNTLIFSKATQYCNIGYKSFGSSADIFCLDYGWSTNITGIICQIRS